MTPANRPQNKRKSFFFWILFVVAAVGIVFASSAVLAYKFYATSKKVIEHDPPKSFFNSMRDIASSKEKSLRGENTDRINILLVGLAGENYPGENLTDSILIASVNPKTFQTALLSIPRDLYVRIPETTNYTKINALYARGRDRHEKVSGGIEDLKSALSEITGLEIHYYVAIDFEGFKQVIDELGGIKIQVPKDIRDERYPGPNYSYQKFSIDKGLWTLEGETALKYARTRHDEDGDFGRAYRQQQILESARQKAYSLGTILNPGRVSELLDTLGDHLRTDVPLSEMSSFLELTKKIDTHTTGNKVLDAGKQDSLLAVSHVYLGNVRAFILLPRTGNYDETRELAENIFELDNTERKREEIRKENSSVLVINESGVKGFSKKIVSLLTKLGYRAEALAEDGGLRTKDNRQKTAIFDVSRIKPFSLEDLRKKLGIESSASMPSETNVRCNDFDFCLFAGSDLTAGLDFEENTIEELEQGYDKQEVDEREYIELLKKGTNKKF